MQIGLIGLNKMGLNLALKLKQNNYDIVAYDVNPTAMESIQNHGIKTATSLKNLAESLETKRVIWLMMPAGDNVDQILQSLQPYLSVSDIIIDGGDSYYQDSMRRSKELEGFQIDLLDCTIREVVDKASGGSCIKVGGNRFAFNYCEQLFKEISGNDDVSYCGKSGSGHYAAMATKDDKLG